MLPRLLIVLLISTCQFAGAAPKTKPAKPTKPDPIALAHEAAKDSLKDPDSARFRGDFVGKDGAVCGFVNAKNSYGGYDGFKRYIVTSDSVMIDGGESWRIDSRWYDFCAEFEPRP
jgi:hypothetical protein